MPDTGDSGTSKHDGGTFKHDTDDGGTSKHEAVVDTEVGDTFKQDVNVGGTFRHGGASLQRASKQDDGEGEDV